jgi:hypothetical protein
MNDFFELSRPCKVTSISDSDDIIKANLLLYYRKFSISVWNGRKEEVPF